MESYHYPSSDGSQPGNGRRGVLIPQNIISPLFDTIDASIEHGMSHLTLNMMSTETTPALELPQEPPLDHTCPETVLKLQALDDLFPTSWKQVFGDDFREAPNDSTVSVEQIPTITEHGQHPTNVVASEDVVNPVPGPHHFVDLKKELQTSGDYDRYIQEIGNGWFRCLLENCEDKNKVYHSRGSIIQHIKEDVGVRRYKCGFCNIRFRKKADCGRHVRDQNEPDKYPCKLPGCSMTFGRKDALKQHKHKNGRVRKDEGGAGRKKSKRQRRTVAPY